MSVHDVLMRFPLALLRVDNTIIAIQAYSVILSPQVFPYDLSHQSIVLTSTRLEPEEESLQHIVVSCYIDAALRPIWRIDALTPERLACIRG